MTLETSGKNIEILDLCSIMILICDLTLFKNLFSSVLKARKCVLFFILSTVTWSLINDVILSAQCRIKLMHCFATTVEDTDVGHTMNCFKMGKKIIVV